LSKKWAILIKEIEFGKYKTKSANYHWEQISKSIWKRNIFVVARYELILDLIGQEIKNKNILDVGCGDGVISYLLAKNGAKVVGIDNSKIAINFAKEKCRDLKNVEFLVASAYKLPFESKIFDYIVSSEVIEHLNNPDKMLYEVKRVWNGKGKIIITTPLKFAL